MDQHGRSTWERVKAWAGSDPSHQEEVAVPGLELFSVGTGHGGRRGVAVPVGTDGTFLVGKAAMQAVLDRHVTDAVALARLSLLFLHEEGELETSGDCVVAPAREGQTLTFFWRTSRGAARNLMRSTVDLKSFQVTTGPGVPHADPLDEARQWLAMDVQVQRHLAVEQLKTLCNDPRAQALLVETALHHGDTATRAEAAAAAGVCKGAQAIAPLAKILEEDRAEAVRIGAATGLGAIGGAHAEAALRAALPKVESMEVKRAIAAALQRIASGAP